MSFTYNNLPQSSLKQKVSSWKKSLIAKAHTFLDYVVARRGYQSEDKPTERQKGSVAFPQKVAKYYGQKSDIDQGLKWYNLPFSAGSGSNGSTLPQRYQKQPQFKRYEYLYELDIDAGAMNRLGVDCQDGNPYFPDFKGRSGISLKGTAPNYMLNSDNLLGSDATGTTLKVFDSNNPFIAYDVKNGCGGTSTYQEIIYTFPFEKSPWDDSDDNLLWQRIDPRDYNGRYLYVNQASDTSKDTRYKNVVSFFAWTGFMDPDIVEEYYPSSYDCSGSNVDLNLENNTWKWISFGFDLSDSNTTNWDEPNAIEKSQSILLINPFTKEWIYENQSDQINCKVVKNVQFIKAPNGYTRILIFFDENDNWEERADYIRLRYKPYVNKPVLSDLYNYFTTGNMPPESALDWFLFNYWDLFKNMRIKLKGDTSDWTWGDHITTTSTQAGLSFEQVIFPNRYVNMVEPTDKCDNKRCEAMYIQLAVGSISKNNNNFLQGSWNTGGGVFCTVDNDRTNCPEYFSYTKNSRIIITVGQKGLSNYSTLKTNKYLFWITDPQSSPPQEKVEGIDYIILNTGINKIGIGSYNTGVWVNGKHYQTLDINAIDIIRAKFWGKRIDYVLEYGLWEQNLSANEFKKLTTV